MENNNRQVCRWVKASERLPEKKGMYHCKAYGRNTLFTDVEIKNISPNHLDGFEWLSESIEPCATSSENDQDELVAWLTTFDNWTKMEAFRFVEKMSKVFDIKKK